MTVIAGRYRLDTLLGQGGTGEVWRAYDLRLERPVALKLLHRAFARDEEARLRLRREADALARLRNEHVVGLLDIDERAERPFIVQEFLPGGTLSPLAATGPHPWRRVRPIALAIARALEHAHAAGVVHRDLKPSNVLFGADGHLFVADFGLARLLSSDDGTLTTTGTRLGSPEYWSPEQAAGQPASERADIYALGVIIFQLLTGQLPFAGEDRLAAGYRRVHEDAPAPGAVERGVPPAVDDLVLRMMRRDPASRPRAADVVRELEELRGAVAEAATVGSAPTTRFEGGATQGLPVDGAPTRVVDPLVTPTDPARARPGPDATRVREPVRLARDPVVPPAAAAAAAPTGVTAGGAIAGLALTLGGLLVAVGIDAASSSVSVARDGLSVPRAPTADDAAEGLAILACSALTAIGLIVLVIWAVRGSSSARRGPARAALSIVAVLLAAVAAGALVWSAYAIASGNPSSLWERATQ